MNQNKTQTQELVAKDLRIGNLLYYKNTNDIAKVELIHNKHFDCRDEYGNFTPNGKYEPIPLTEELLLKCGAFLHGIEYIIKASALPVKIRFHSQIAYCEMGNVYLGDRIKYLHELQNLIFILCGKEVEVR